MSVRNHQLLVLHRFLNCGHALRLRNHPQPVDHAVLIEHFRCRRRSRFGFRQNRVDALLRVRIQHEKLPGVRLRVPQKFQPVGFRPGKRVLVPEDDPRGILLQFSRPDKAAPRAAYFVLSDRIAVVRPGNRVFLRVSIKRRRGILHHHLIVNPVLDRRSRARVHIVLRRIAGVRAAFLHRDEVVRVRGVIFFLHRRRNLVVRLRQDAVERRARRVVAKSAKGINLGHEFSGIVLCRPRSFLVYANKPEFRKRHEVNFR